MTVSLNTTTGTATVLERGDFATTAFICDGGLLEPTVNHTTSIVGNGSTTDPLAVFISADAGNDIVFGSDGGIYVDVATGFSFIVSDGTNTQTINSGNTLLFADAGAAIVTVSATDTVTIDVPLPTRAAECPSGYFVGTAP